jgi:hypothetical protein
MMNIDVRIDGQIEEHIKILRDSGHRSIILDVLFGCRLKMLSPRARLPPLTVYNLRIGVTHGVFVDQLGGLDLSSYGYSTSYNVWVQRVRRYIVIIVVHDTL